MFLGSEFSKSMFDGQTLTGKQQAMPVLMPRPKLHRAICDCFDCATVPTSVSAVSVAARQEPPPKCLVILTDHEWPLGVKEAAATPLSGYENVCQKAEGCPELPVQVKLTLCDISDGNLSVVSQLLHQGPSQALAAPKQLHERYNNLQTGFMSTAPQACLLAKEAGMQILPLVHISETQGKPVQKGLSGWPPPSVMAQTIMTVLGFDEDAPDGSSCSQAFMAASDDDATDLLFLHVAWDNTCSGKGCSSSATLHHWLDEVLKFLFQYSTFSSSVLAAILLRNQQADALLQASSEGAVFEAEDFPRVIRPQQSHCISNMQTVSISLRQSSLIIQHLPGVVRQDNVQTLSPSEFRVHGGGGCILAEHVLPELTYKLGRAAKYGA